MGSLLTKELRAQLPIVWMIVFLTTIPYLASSLTQIDSIQSLEELYGEGLINMGMDWAIVAGILSLAISYGLLVREIDDRTIEFLDALPVSRTQLFVTKWVAAMSVLLLLPLLDSVVMVGLRGMSMTSLDRSYHFDWVATSIFLQCVQLFGYFSIGLLLSFFRRFGWLILGIALWTLMVLGRFLPQWKLENLLLLSEAQFEGQRWLIPWDLVIGYVVVGVIASGLAYILFLGGGRRLLKLLDGSESRGKQVALIGTSILIAIVFIGLVSTATINMEDPGESDAVRVQYPSWSTANRQTKHFRAVFPENLAGRAGAMLDRADETYETVAEFFDYESSVPIQIDMTGASQRHLGTAYWNKLKIDLMAHDDTASLRRTLGHETTHVILESLSDNQLRENFGSTRFFHEGVATYVERRFFAEDLESESESESESNETTSNNRLGAAVLASRKEANFERLIDDAQLRQEHDTFLAYELGEVFASAVVERFGDDSLGKLARSLAEKKHSEGLSGVALWRSVFQASGYSLSEAVDEYYQLLEQAMQRHAETIAKLSELHPIIEASDGVLLLSIDVEPPPSWQIVIRFRASAAAMDDEYWMQTVDEDGIVTVSTEKFVGRSAWYQVGYRLPSEMPIFQTWQTVRLPR